MLGDKTVMATIAVKDIGVARNFYEGVLGLKAANAESGNAAHVVKYKVGSSGFLVYRSEYAGTNRATSATWAVNDVEETVAGLKAKGVKFEQYDFPGTVRKGDVHFFGDIKAAWFKDPDGNIHNVVNG